MAQKMTMPAAKGFCVVCVWHETAEERDRANTYFSKEIQSLVIEE